MIPQRIFDIIKELRYLLIGLLGHAVENLLDKMLLIASTCFDDQFARRGTLFSKYALVDIITRSELPGFVVLHRLPLLPEIRQLGLKAEKAVQIDQSENIMDCPDLLAK